MGSSGGADDDEAIIVAVDIIASEFPGSSSSIP